MSLGGRLVGEARLHDAGCRFRAVGRTDLLGSSWERLLRDSVRAPKSGTCSAGDVAAACSDQ